jgi:hypothetical protein
LRVLPYPVEFDLEMTGLIHSYVEPFSAPEFRPPNAGHGRLAMPAPLAFLPNRWAEPDAVSKHGFRRISAIIAPRLCAFGGVLAH